MREVYFKYIGPHKIGIVEAKDMNEEERQIRIWRHCEKLSAELLKYDEEDEARWKKTEKEFKEHRQGE